MKLRLPKQLCAALLAAAAVSQTALADYSIDEATKICTITGTQDYLDSMGTNDSKGGHITQFTLAENAVFTATGAQFGYGSDDAQGVTGTKARELVMNTGSKLVVNSDTNMGWRQIGSLTLNGDATVEVNGQIGMIEGDYAANTLTLNNHTLHLTRTSSGSDFKEFRLDNTTVKSGTIDIARGVKLYTTSSVKLYGSDRASAADNIVSFNVQEGGMLDLTAMGTEYFGRDAAFQNTNAYRFVSLVENTTGAGTVKMNGMTIQLGGDTTYQPDSLTFRSNYEFGGSLNLADYSKDGRQGRKLFKWIVGSQTAEGNTVNGSIKVHNAAGNAKLTMKNGQTLVINEGGAVEADLFELGQDSSYPSYLSMSGGSLKIGTTTSNGSSTFTVTGGTLEFTSANAFGTNSSLSVSIGGTESAPVVLKADTASWTLNHNASIGHVSIKTTTDKTVTLGASGTTTTFSDAIMNNGALKLDGTLAGSLNLTNNGSATFGANAALSNNATMNLNVTDGSRLVLESSSDFSKAILFAPASGTPVALIGTGTIALGNDSNITVAGGANVATAFTGSLDIGRGTLTLGQAVGGDYGSSPNVSSLSSISLGGGNLNIVGWGSNHYHSLSALVNTESTLTIYQHDNSVQEGGHEFVFENATTVNGTLNIYAGNNSSYGTCTEDRADLKIVELAGNGNLVLGEAEDNLKVKVESWGDYSGKVAVSGHTVLSAAALATSAKFSGDGRVEITGLLGGRTGAPYSGAFSGVSADEKFTGTLSLKRQDVEDHDCTLTLTNFAGTLEWRGRLNLNGTSFGNASKIVLDTDGVTNCTSLWANNGNKTIDADVQIVGSGAAEINANNVDVTLNGALTGDSSSTFNVTTRGNTVILAGNVEGFGGTYHIGGGALAFNVASGTQTISNTITGSAIFRKIGDGTLNFSGSIAAGTTVQNRNNGSFVLDNATLSGNGRLNISEEGTITFKNGITDNTTATNRYAVVVENSAVADFTAGTYDFAGKNVAMNSNASVKVSADAELNVGAMFYSSDKRGSIVVENNGSLTVGAGPTVTATNYAHGVVRVNRLTNKGQTAFHGETNIGTATNEGTLKLLGTGSKNIEAFTQRGQDAKLIIGDSLDVTTNLADSGSVQGSFELQSGAHLNIKQLGAEVTASLKDLTLAENAIMGVYTDNSTNAASEADISVSGTLKAGSGATLNANLTVNGGATIDVAAGGLHMGSTLTFAGGEKMHVSDSIVNGLNSLSANLAFGGSVTLFSGVDAFSIGDSAYDAGTTYKASDYFNLAGVNRPWDFVIKYDADAAADGGTVSLYMEMPEPATATLSLLALAALAAKRKRK